MGYEYRNLIPAAVVILRLRMSLSKSNSGTAAVPPSAPLGAAFTTGIRRSNLNLSPGIGWRLQLFVFLIAAAAVVSRRPDAIFNPQFFGEDGPVWYGQAYAFGWLISLLHSQNGYFQTLPRLAASLALLAPLRFAPLVMNLIGITLQVLPVNILLSSRSSNWAPLNVRAWMAVAYIALPNSMELNITVEEGQWHLALLACMVILACVPKIFRWRVFDIAIILLCGVSGPFCLMLLPIAVIFWWLRRQPWRLVAIAAFAVTSVIQLSAIVQSGAATRPKVGLGATPQLFIKLLAGQVYLGALLGQHSWSTHKNLVLLTAVALLGTAILVFCFIKTGLELKLFILFAVLVFAASLKSPMVSLTVPQWEVLKDAPGIRYWFFPMLAFVWALIWCAGVSSVRPVRMAAGFGLACMVIGVARDWEFPPYTDFHFAEHARQFASAAPGTFMSIPIYPDGWQLRLTKKNPSCHTLPVGVIDQPIQNARLSDATIVRGWVTGTSPVRQVSVYVDHSLVQSTTPTIERADIDQLYPQSPGKEKGWTTVIDMSKISPGKHEIELRAFEANGCDADFATVPVETRAVVELSKDRAIADTQARVPPGRNNLRALIGRAFSLPGYYRKQLTILVLIALAVWLALSWFQLIQTILHYYNPFPIWDYWHVVTDLKDIESLHLRVLWQQHNDHRIIFPEIVFATDMLLFHGLQILPLVASFLCYLAMWVLIARALIADTKLSAAVRALAILLAGIMMGWRGSAQVVGVPFLLQWTLLQVMVLLALWLLWRAKDTQKLGYLAAAIACAVVANYSAANGLFLWPILLIAAWILRLRLRHLSILALAAVISSTTFFIGYHSTGKLNLSNFLVHPVYSFEFLCSYLSVPFGLVQPGLGVCLGLASLAGFCILVVLAARNRLLTTEPGILLFGSYVFTVATAVLISSGRMDPTDPTFLSAKAERFVSIPVVTWAVLIAAALWVTYRRGWKIASYVIALLTVALLLKVLPRTRVWVQSHDNTIREQQWATLSIESGIFDPELVRKVYPDPNLVTIALPALRTYYVSIYSFAYSRWLSQPVSSEFATSQVPGSGEITQVYPLRGGLEVLGWAEGAEHATYFPKIVFVNDRSQIVGFGRRLKLGLPVGLASLRTPASIAWVGFVEFTDRSKTFSAYVIDRRARTLTPIGSSVSFPDVQAAATQEIGPPISNVNWKVEGAWTKNLIPPGVEAGAAPSEFLASWSGNDANTGSIISSPITAPANRCVILPVLHGPEVDGLSAKVVNAEMGELIATAPMQGAGTQWRYWRVPLDPGVKHFRIEAADEGRGWGEWLAIGAPSQCH